MKQVLFIPHLLIQNANALSSPFTMGFPAMTAWLGACHALQRLLNQADWPDLKFKSVGICCHDFNLHVYKGIGDYVSSIIGTGNPLDRTGARPAFIEEARCNLEVSLVIECSSVGADLKSLIQKTEELLFARLKIAGGDILGFRSPTFMTLDTQEHLRQLTAMMTPGYVVLERRDLMISAMKEEGLNALEALLSYLQVRHASEEDEEGNVSWTSQRKTAGWIVPIATGFQGISPLGNAQHQRTPETPHRFAESAVTLGEFVMPHRLKSIDEMLWHYHVDLEKNSYLCQQNTYEEIKNG